MQTELNYYKDVQKSLKDQVERILKENQAVYSEIQILRCSEENRSEALNNNDAVLNLKAQIVQLEDERNTLTILWKISQERIYCLEKEIRRYKNQSSKPASKIEIQDSHTLHLLESTITNLQNELERQKIVNKEQVNIIKDLEERITVFEKDNQENDSIIKYTENGLKEKQKQISTTRMETNSVYENSIAIVQDLASNIIYFREKEALEKVQEALQIAESALLEREAASCREKIVRDECEELAKTIGKVMEDAAVKVDKSVANIRSEYEKKVINLQAQHDKVTAILQSEQGKTNAAEIKAAAYESNLTDIMQKNITLNSELQEASQAIVLMELKLKDLEKFIDHDQIIFKLSDKSDQVLQYILLNNKQLKERWKNAIEEVTKKLRNEITCLQKENTLLKIENQDLRIKLQK